MWKVGGPLWALVSPPGQWGLVDSVLSAAPRLFNNVTLGG